MNGEQWCEVVIERPVSTQDTDTGIITITWESIAYEDGSPQVAMRLPAQVQDLLPSKAEYVTQGLSLVKGECRLRMGYRNDITSDMRVTVYRDSAVTYQIKSGPAEIGARKSKIEMMLEKFNVTAS